MSVMSGESVGKQYIENSRNVDLNDARITNQLGFLDDQLRRLRECIGDLGDRLVPILLPEITEKNPGIDVPSKPTSPMSDQIDGYISMIRHLQDQVVNLSNRIQL